MNEPTYFEYTTDKGFLIKAGDIVTCYYSGFFEVVGFYDYLDTYFRTQKIPQVILKPRYDSNGIPRNGKLKSASVEYMALAAHCIPKLINDLNKKEDSLLTLLHIIRKHDFENPVSSDYPKDGTCAYCGTNSWGLDSGICVCSHCGEYAP